mgnify:CR=1 FL=1
MVVEVQRGGLSTGIRTKTEQADSQPGAFGAFPLRRDIIRAPLSHRLTLEELF